MPPSPTSSAALAGWSGLPEVRRDREGRTAQGKHPPRPVEVLRLPEAIHRPHRDRLRVQPCPAAYLAASHLPDGSSKKGIAPASFSAPSAVA